MIYAIWGYRQIMQTVLSYAVTMKIEKRRAPLKPTKIQRKERAVEDKNPDTTRDITGYLVEAQNDAEKQKELRRREKRII